MEHSFVADGEVHEAMATGHRPWFGTKRPLPENATDRGTAPQGGIVASASDLARYMQMMMNGEDDVLSAEGKALMMRPASAASPFYGFGWFVDPANGTCLAFRVEPRFRNARDDGPRGTEGGRRAGQRGQRDWVSGKRPSSATASPPGRSASTTTARQPDGPRRPCSSRLVLLPIVYLLSMVWAWRHRDEIRAKSGGRSACSACGSRCSPRLARRGFIFGLVPSLFGLTLGTLCLFQPDLGLVLIATAVTGVLWAVFRLGVAYTGKSGPA